MTEDSELQDLLCFNGVQASTGDYGLPPMSSEKLSSFLLGEEPPDNLDELRTRHAQRKKRHYGLREGVDPKKLDESGWGVIFAHDADLAVKEALQPLLDLRRDQAGALFKLYEKADGYRTDEPKAKFLARHGAGPGPADPQKVPYYLLIVGSPESIPFRFQSQLDVQYAVGRIHFDAVEDYAHYAASVVAAERGLVLLPRRAGVFGVRNDDDQATSMSFRRLIRPMHRHLEAKHPDWQVDKVLHEQSTKANLKRLLGGEQTPALLFTSSHGVEFRATDKRQISHQGAILCQDWAGPKAGRGIPLTKDFYFSGDDISSDARLLGLICFSFACYGAGTPQFDEFSKQAFQDQPSEIAPHPFLAGLPKKMLSHPAGGALAFIGHVERAWGYSFLWEGAGTQTAVFESAVDRLLDGYPVGAAFEYFDQRYAELSTMLADQLEEADCGVEVDPYDLVGMWTANNDARGYVVIGDPAVRLPTVLGDAEPKARPVLAELQAEGRLGGSQGSLRSPDGNEEPVAEKAVESAEPSDAPDAASSVAQSSATELGTVSLEFTVSTYTGGDPSDPSTGTLCARTHFSATGDVTLHIGEDVDESVLELHQKTVKEAVRARLAALPTTADRR